jgi:hypothetical protein
MVVDGICIQFLGWFDCSNKAKKHPDSSTQQINGVGRVELDEEYYRELSSVQVCFSHQLSYSYICFYLFSHHLKVI